MNNNSSLNVLNDPTIAAVLDRLYKAADRLLYVFVGLMPTVFFITGLVN